MNRKTGRLGTKLEKTIFVVSIIVIIVAIILGIRIVSDYAQVSEETTPVATTTSQVETSISAPIATSDPTEPTTTTQQVTVQIQEAPTYTDDELFCMAAAIYNEAGGDSCSDETRRLVGYVILNRVADTRFPNTIRDVLEEKRQYGNFYWTGIVFPERSTQKGELEAVERSYKIAKEVLLCDDIPIPSNIVFQAEFIQGTGTYIYQDGIYFCGAEEVN